MDHTFEFDALPAITEFGDVVDPLHYFEVPPSWSLVLTDVRGSTRAIEQGRYKDVNALGAASIVALKNAVVGSTVPYIFGGDGITALVGNDRLSQAEEALRGVATLSRRAFDLELRVAVVPIRDLIHVGASVQVARYQLAPTVYLAMLSGPGVGLAETWVKSAERGPRYHVDPDGPADADFTGFECRWRPLPTQRGRVVCLLVEAQGSTDPIKTAVYRRVLAKLTQVLDGLDGRPLMADKMRLRSVFSDFREESRIHAGSERAEDVATERRRIQRATAIGRFLIAAGLKGGDFDGRRYRDELVLHTDFRKFDGVLRMVLDLTHAQIDELCAFLGNEHTGGQLIYGLHSSDAALVTCCVDDYRENHVHFVDGSDGGYALAAKQLKAQKSAIHG